MEAIFDNLKQSIVAADRNSKIIMGVAAVVVLLIIYWVFFAKSSAEAFIGDDQTGYDIIGMRQQLGSCPLPPEPYLEGQKDAPDEWDYRNANVEKPDDYGYQGMATEATNEYIEDRIFARQQEMFHGERRLLPIDSTKIAAIPNVEADSEFQDGLESNILQNQIRSFEADQKISDVIANPVMANKLISGIRHIPIVTPDSIAKRMEQTERDEMTNVYKAKEQLTFDNARRRTVRNQRILSAPAVAVPVQYDTDDGIHQSVEQFDDPMVALHLMTRDPTL